ncbi:MAG: glycerophosphoryl diester phosphodiesterase [Solirubrobacteraceae bacterium]|nr:glycerophosphoryl diester phosphodiesterase [Solirubrobacteraceae bacterium]
MEIIAHRGASADAPENTVAAYDLAFEQGAGALEIDLRLTADNRVVALHDATLGRTHGDSRALADLTLGHLAVLEDPPPRLRDLLVRYRRRRLLIELKDSTPALERRVLKSLVRAGLRSRIVLQSFEHAGLRRLNELDPLLAIAPLYDNAELDLGAAQAFGATGIGVRHDRIDVALVAAAHDRGLVVRAWTVNDPDRAAELAALGVDALITDVPGQILATVVAAA